MALSRILIVLFTMACSATCFAAEPLRIHFISGSNEYKSEESLRKLQRELEEGYRIECSGSWVRDGASQLENLDSLAATDLLVVFARRLKLGEEQMEVIRNHWEQGKPVIGIRTAGHAFGQADNEVLDRQVLGGHYAGHYGNEEVRVTNMEDANDHPVLRGVTPFTSRKLYKAGELPNETVVLQVGSIDKAEHPVTIVHEYKHGRMFFTALGVSEDFENESFRAMLRNAVFWTTQRSAEELKKQ